MKYYKLIIRHYLIGFIIGLIFLGLLLSQSVIDGSIEIVEFIIVILLLNVLLMIMFIVTDMLWYFIKYRKRLSYIQYIERIVNINRNDIEFLDLTAMYGLGEELSINDLQEDIELLNLFKEVDLDYLVKCLNMYDDGDNNKSRTLINLIDNGDFSDGADELFNKQYNLLLKLRGFKS